MPHSSLDTFLHDRSEANHPEVILRTGRLTLKMWSPRDAPLVAQLHSCPETTRYIFSGGGPWSMDHAQDRLDGWFAEHALYGTTKYKIVRNDDHAFIGRAGFSRFSIPEPHFELGYALCLDAWGQGYATEIAHALSVWFFSHRLSQRFTAFTHPDNLSSQRILRKIGMQDSGPVLIDNVLCPNFKMTSEEFHRLHGVDQGSIRGQAESLST